jgi:ribosomal protein S21
MERPIGLFVELMQGESPDGLMRRFDRMVRYAGILSEAKRRRYFVSEGERRRLAMKKAIKRQRKRAAARH